MDSLVGGAEGESAQRFQVNADSVRESLDTGLFSSWGQGRMGWRHQTYADSLAATFLNSRNLSPRQLESVLVYPDHSRKVVPQLREVAAWLAGMNSAVFDMLCRANPEILLRGDSTIATDASKIKLAKFLLRSFELDGQAESLWSLRGEFHKLSCAGLSAVIEPYIVVKTIHWEARRTAIEIAAACEITSLYPQMVAIALNHLEPERLRVNAASAIADIGDSQSRSALRPLALGQTGEDPDDELKGYGLLATWPAHLSTTELFGSLAPAKRTDYIGGSYFRFLNSDIATQLPRESVVEALEWATRNTRVSKHTRIYQLVLDIGVRSTEYLDDPSICEGLARLLLELRRDYKPCNQIKDALRTLGDSPRRRVAKVMLAFASGNHVDSKIRYACSLDSNDTRWLLEQLESESDSQVRKVIAAVIAQTMDPGDVNVFSIVLTVASLDLELGAEIRPQIAAVVLGTSEARDAQTNWSTGPSPGIPRPAPNAKKINNLTP